MKDFEEIKRRALMGLQMKAEKNKMKGESMSDSQQAMLEGLKAEGVDPTKSEKWEKAKRGMGMLEAKRKGVEIIKAREGEGEQTTICPNCNKEVPIGNFCGNCAGKLEKIEKTEKTTVCPNCNKEVPVGKFCSSCGNKLEEFKDDSRENLGEANVEIEKNLKTSEGKVGDAESIVDELFSVSDSNYLTEKIKEVKTRKDLMNFLDTVPGVDGANKFFASNELKQLINDILDKKDMHKLDNITRACGLREKVAGIMYQERKEEIGKM